MAYALSFGLFEVLPGQFDSTERVFSCTDARSGCSPAYVFSIDGQVEFRGSLQHLAECSSQACRSLRAKVRHGMLLKLKWLMNVESLLGCVQIQPYLFGGRRVLLDTKHFPHVAHHLASCPKESCAQLRRAVLLTVRETVKPDFQTTTALAAY